VQLKKEVISMQKQPNCDKNCATLKARIKKDIKSKVVEKKWF